ncbi:hypothetical protein ACFOD4_16630 [Pseudoroseomonas globiformis]|uniref:Uncharacterized protein n=1 Tax=Teichococcus globiformis TaxID=2307229 RepID=A0ABV7G4U3_9PROT
MPTQHKKQERTMGWKPSYDFDKEFSVEIDLDADTYIDYDVNVDASVDICIDPYVEGNTATFSLDVQAFGDDTYVDANAVAVTTDHMSSVAMTGLSVSD